MSYTPTILIVDDDPVVRDTLETLLRQHGFETRTVSSGEKAIECLDKDEFDLVLLDIVMPGIDGIQVMEHIFSHSEDTVVIIITGHTSTESAIEALRRGAYYYLSKPIEHEELLKMVKNGLDQKRLKTERKRAEEAVKKAHDELERRVKERTEELSEANEQLKREVGDRKEAEEALRQSEGKYRALVEESFDGIFIQKGSKIIFANKRLSEMLGYEYGELLGKNHWLVYHPDYQEQTRKRAQARMRGEKVTPQYEVKLHCKDGSWLYGELNARAIIVEGEPGVQVWIKDISERKLAEDKLRHEKKRLDSLIEHSSLAIVTLDEKHRIVSCNRDFEELFQFEEAESTGKNLDEILAREEFFPTAASYTEKTIKGEAIHGTGRRYRKDGTLIDVEFFGVPVIVDGEIIGAYGIYKDIGERVQTEEALRESEERYRSLFDSINDFIYTHDLQGHIVTINRAAAQTIGYTPGELIGRPISDFMLPEYQKGVKKEYLAQVEKQGFSNGVSIYLDKEDKSHYLEYRNILVEREGKEPYVSGVGRDITERIEAGRRLRRLEKQFQHAQKMEAIGTLAGGVAHDFNNLLMGIQGHTSLMLMDIGSSHPHFEDLNEIEQHVKSATELTRQLLAFARGGRYEVKPTDLNEIVKKSSEMFGRTKKEIAIHPKYQDDIWTTEVDQGQIDQVLLNLYVNAWQVMPHGGDLYLQTENVVLDQNHSKVFRVSPGKYVKISVTDTGVGMDEATRQRIFDPFFTTKEMGRGTGLGLASVYGTIKNHDGIINVSSEKGKGTTFDIYLPASEKELLEEEELVEQTLKGSETVLLVDDEEMIIGVGKKMLEKLGYKVVIARSGKEAIKVYQKSRDKIDVTVLDMIMPGMDGGETYDRLKEINPEIKAILSSGYSIDGRATEILERGCQGFIQKPFNMEGLSQKLREILDKKWA